MTAAKVEKLLAVEPELAMGDLQQYRDHFNQFGKRMPKVLYEQLNFLANRLHYQVTKVRYRLTCCSKICT